MSAFGAVSFWECGFAAKWSPPEIPAGGKRRVTAIGGAVGPVVCEICAIRGGVRHRDEPPAYGLPYALLGQDSTPPRNHHSTFPGTYMSKPNSQLFEDSRERYNQTVIILIIARSGLFISFAAYLRTQRPASVVTHA